MESFVGEEGGDSGGRMFGVVVGKFRHWKVLSPIGLIVVDVESKVRFEDLVDSFRLSVRFWMICGRQVLLDLELLR